MKNSKLVVSRKQRCGAAAVEFAIVAPFFIMLVFGMMEFGRGIMVHQILVNASREGARIAVMDTGTTAEIEDIISSYMASAGIDTEQVLYYRNGTAVENPTGANSGAGDAIGVEVRVEFNDVSWMPIPEYLNDKSLSAMSVMRRETYQ